MPRVPDASHTPDRLSRAAGGLAPARAVTRNGMRLLAGVALLCGITACSSLPGHHAIAQYTPSRCYPSPGSPSDRWGPYIREASGRFGVEEVLIREVMRQESGGKDDAVSRAGAIGLMQLMPDTYDELRRALIGWAVIHSIRVTTFWLGSPTCGRCLIASAWRTPSLPITRVPAGWRAT